MNNKIISILLFVIFLFQAAEGSEKPENTPQIKIPPVILSESHSYLLHECLGKGAYGTVYRATDENNDELAIKIFHHLDDFNLSFYFVTRSWPNLKSYRSFGLLNYENEWSNGQIFIHPNIVHPFERGEFADEAGRSRQFIVYELVKGRTLSELEDNSLAKEDALNLAIEYLESKIYALGLKKIYIDCHSENFMVTDDKHFKVLDIASFVDAEACAGFPVSLLLRRYYSVTRHLLKKSQFTAETVKTINSKLKKLVVPISALKLTCENCDEITRVLYLWKSVFEEERMLLEASQQIYIGE